MPIPVLDPKPTGRPMFWTIKKLHELKEVEVVRPPSWDNPDIKDIVERDQAVRGTCTGQGGAEWYDTDHITLTGQRPTPDEKKQFKKDVVDQLGTTHDILYPQSISAEGVYQISRKIGNVTYPEGSETRFVAQALQQYGVVLESMWHTDKTGKCVWTYANHPIPTNDGGVSQADAAAFAAQHTIDGYAMVGDETGSASFDEICDAIYKYRLVLAGIPVYSNFTQMEGGDGSFPEPEGDIAGYHCLLFYGYDEDNIHLRNSWGPYCSINGSVSKHYTNMSVQESVYLVMLDSADTPLLRDYYKKLVISVTDKATGTPLAADITVNGTLVGKAPQTISVEPNTSYDIEVSMAGYISQKKSADDSLEEIAFQLDAETPATKKTWWEVIVDWIKKLLGWN